MIDISIVRRMQTKKAYELHMQLCAKIERAIVNAAMDSHNELLVQLPNAMQLALNAHQSSIRLEDYDYGIELLQFCLINDGYDVEKAASADSFIIKW